MRKLRISQRTERSFCVFNALSSKLMDAHTAHVLGVALWVILIVIIAACFLVRPSKPPPPKD